MNRATFVPKERQEYLDYYRKKISVYIVYHYTDNRMATFISD